MNFKQYIVEKNNKTIKELKKLFGTKEELMISGMEDNYLRYISDNSLESVTDDVLDLLKKYKLKNENGKYVCNDFIIEISKGSVRIKVEIFFK